jgi:hypothetical protein
MATTKNKPKAIKPMQRINVHWKAHEREIVAKLGAQAFRNGEVSSPLQALHAGQVGLDEDRKRPNVHSVGEKSSDGWFRPAFTKELTRLREQEEQQQAERQEATTNATAIPEPVTAAEPPRLNGASVESVSTVAADIGQAFLNLRAMLVDELASVFVEAALKAIGSTQFGEQHVRLTDAGSEHQRIVFQRTPTVRKPGILVVGLKGAQKSEIIRDYSARFDLRFIGSDESKDQLRAMTEKAETTVVMTDFISHSHEDIVKARSPNYVRSPGGMTQLRETLASLAH